MKRTISIILALVMVLSLLPTAAFAAVDTAEPGKPYTSVAPGTTAIQNYLEADVTWIGTTDDYKKTLAAFSDHGLRKVPVGDLKADGTLGNIKYGLIDSSGRWVAQPVYDKIQAEYWTGDDNWSTGVSDRNQPTEHIFVDGYVQATRNDKMGLLDDTGKEVVPCEYNAVGLPVEGVCRLIQKVGEKYFIGYWNLELSKEIVKPNKYIADYSSSTAGTAIAYGWGYKPASANRMVCKFDFNGGYALVLTGKTETLVAKGWFGENPGRIDKSRKADTDYSYKTIYAQLIDKNGKERLPQAYPILAASLLTGEAYPQNGPYMVFQAVSDKLVSVQSDQGGSWAVFDKHLEEGVVSASGVVIPAKYWGGWTAGLRRPGMWRFAPQPYGGQTRLFPDEGIIAVQYCNYTVSELSSDSIVAKPKFINFAGKDVTATMPKGSQPKALDPDGNMRKIELGSGIISGVQVKVSGDDSRVKYLVDVKTGQRLTDDQWALKSLGRGLFVTSYGDYYGPDGKIVFPRAEKVTTVKNNPNASEQSVGEDLTLVVRDGKVGYINASRLARNSSLPTTTRVKPQPPAMPDWSKWVEKAEPIVVPEGVNVIAGGSYYMQIFGKYLVPIESDFNEYSVQLSSKKPDYPFIVKLVSYDTERGPAYDITYNGGATWNASKDGDAFKFGKGGVDTTTPKWKISKYSTFCTIRKYKDQALAVNASGTKSADGTKVTVWTYKGSAPDHAKITFIKAD